eukprot:TRINITY_DN500_c0_g1_i6.p2 TRINITY_DN500_c0_g1~~TRINITY_DN500_c0_g1_i6.p2  ORF type:complete len:327 (+),score=116.63 TRINITY_DN500_c0_g1_i6:88-1068(+)
MRSVGPVMAALMGVAQASETFEAFKAAHGKKYANAGEEQLRAEIFEANMAKARELSKGEPLASFGASPYADLTEAEFAEYHSSGSFYATADRSGFAAAETFPAWATAAAEAGSVDWRSKGAVTAVKNQKQCGSCWAFSTTGNVEGQWFLAGHKLTALSEQQLVSCDKGFGDKGCMGGLPSNAYKYIVSAGGLESEADYPYKSTLPISFGKCKFEKSKVAATITGGQLLTAKEDQMLAWMTKNGPVSIGVNAAGSTWQLYKGGIVKNCADKQPDHGVLIVGYGTDGSQPYWVVKNSWGPSWGEQGYIRLAYGSNQCNIADTPTSVKI